ncbi:MAG: HNH endonuclease [Flavobacteriaceae bacterium]|jgi:hypothetical protein|nr:HNH endonuclease [Flavobacteriaceae bacterium]
MRIGIIVLLITAFLIFNMYHDGKYVAILKSWKKYYQMAGVAFIGLSLYLFIKKKPDETHNVLSHATDLVKYMPMDRNATDFLSPLLQMGKRATACAPALNGGMAGGGGGGDEMARPQTQRMLQSGKGNATKRSVGESKKKFVAASQGWRCKHCQTTLKAWFEVDHVVRLQHGGSNHVDNLVALCRECHGKKTMTETFDL